MKKNHDLKRNPVVLILSACTGAAALFFLLVALTGNMHRHNAVASGQLTPWQFIGGCGAGGSGGGSAGIKWVGEGVSGGSVKLEVMPKFNIGRTFAYLTTAPRLTFNPQWNTEVAVSMPLALKTAEVQYQTNIDDPQLVMNGVRGDLTADLTRSFGSENQYSCQLSLTLPTGQYDAKRGTDKSQNILPQSLQMGQGVYAATLGLSYTRDIDKGMLLCDGYFYYPFNISFTGKNAYLNSDYKAYKNVTENRRRFYYWFKPYGENDRGGYFPPSLSFDGIYSYRGVPKMVQSFQFFFSAPLGVKWIPYYDQSSNIYDPRPDPDNRAWDAVLAYGIEFSRDMFPVFLGFALPVHDKKGVAGSSIYDPAPFAKWNAPDWDNIGQEFIFALGFKVAMF
ncbi:MAG TPA: hypothetical protein DCO75_03720 [Fibrobacteres bacterium]|nr:hypothetical protein [Fibrobacterota bacterium]